MSDVSSWLETLGLGKYAKAFEDNEIDFASLPHLTEGMLDAIGLPIGPKAKLLAAISGLTGLRVRGSEKSRAPGSPEPRGERRQLTVMFCDLVDSTKLATRMDPEDYGNMIQAYQRAFGAVIDRYEGHISQYRGDGIEVLFGWPAAQEDAAERAVRAGLDAVEAVRALKRPESLSVRIGITTGIVVTGLDDPSSPSGAVGKSLHLASRLQNLAAPDSVLIAEPTSRLISTRFEQEDLGPQMVKGLAEPIRVFRVLRLRANMSRFRAATARAMTPLVGRTTELAFLQQRWRDATGGEGQAVFVSGIAGIGKSRIVFELERLIENDPHFSFGLQCLPHCMQSAFFPVIQQIERLANLASEDSDELKLKKIERLVARATDRLEMAAPLLADLLSVPPGARYPPLALSAQRMKTETLSVLIALVRAASEKRPVFCLLEDAQWIDPSTQELLDLLVGQVDRGRILLVVTHRPDYQPPARVHGNVSGLTITRLGRRDVREMARLVTDQRPLSPMAVKKIIEESDAIPLFVEELARGAIESAGADDPALAGDRPESRAPGLVPDSLRDSLIARLDRAPGARNVAQMAAAIGREFYYDVLLRISSLSDSELDSTLAHLRESDIVQVIDARPPIRYIFKHALLRDAAYESLLRSTRREIHAKIASVLETDWPDVAAAQPELLAYHYSLGGKAEFAVRHWLLGGRRARDHSANLEAIVQFQKALEFLQFLPETPERVATEVEIQLALGYCFIAVHGYSSDDTRKSFERAYSLTPETAESQKHIQAIFGLWGHYWMRARHDRALEFADSLLAKAEQAHEPMMPVLAHRSLGSTMFTLGRFDLARDHLERALALGQQTAVVNSPLSFAVDPRIAARLLLAWDLWILGFPQRAFDAVRQAVQQAADPFDPYTAAFADYVASAVHLLRGEFRESLAFADRSFALSEKHRINLYALYSRFGRGCALTKIGQNEQALIEIRKGIEEAQRSNLGYMRGFMLGWLATAQAENGEAESGLSTIDMALSQTDDVTGRAWEAELRRLRGEILLVARPEAAKEAERHYNEAAAIAQRQEARSLELRANVSLARLLRLQGRDDEARRRLSSILAWFSEGFDTADLREAKQLLDGRTPA